MENGFKKQGHIQSESEREKSPGTYIDEWGLRKLNSHRICCRREVTKERSNKQTNAFGKTGIRRYKKTAKRYIGRDVGENRNHLHLERGRHISWYQEYNALLYARFDIIPNTPITSGNETSNSFVSRRYLNVFIIAIIIIIVTVIIINVFACSQNISSAYGWRMSENIA